MKEPELVASGLAFLVPAYVAWTGGQNVSAAALAFLAVTSSIWHIIHEEWFRPFDFIAMLVVIVLELMNSMRAGVDGVVLAILVCTYGVIAYHWGYTDSTFCFGQSRSRQMTSHALIHILAAIAITLNLWTIQENEKSSSQTTSST
jgi:K+-sensing histidine kinase KdpD